MEHNTQGFALAEQILSTHNLVSFWDFQEEAGRPRVAKGPHTYALKEGEGAIERIDGGILGPYAARLKFGQWFQTLREEGPELDIHGKDAQVTVIAWVKREERVTPECQAIAGMWNETRKQRQYCLFLDLIIWDSHEQVGGHVSGVGGPTAGHPWCMDASIGQTEVPYGEWQCIAFSYDARHARSYLNGQLDERPQFNPYAYEEGLFDGGPDGADFTVGAVHRGGEMGNFFNGVLGGLAVFNRALTPQEMERIGKVR